MVFAETVFENGNRALMRITPRIDLKKIGALIDATPYITELQKRLYKTMLAERKEKILDASLAKLRKRDCLPSRT